MNLTAVKKGGGVQMLDFDEIDDWAPMLSTELRLLVPTSVKSKLETAAPEYIEDALDFLFESSDRCDIIEATLTWLRSSKIAGYHGTRLMDAEVASVRLLGLIPLRAEDRRNRLARALSPHPRWHEVESKLDAAIMQHGQGCYAGCREKQVHLTLSKSGLTKSFNHYLTHGAEFDQHVAASLLSSEGMELLERDGEPRIIRVLVPGEIAVTAANPYFDINEFRTLTNIPNLVRQFLEVWSYRLAYPRYQSRHRELDCGMVFRSAVPPEWILEIETLDNRRLRRKNAKR